MPDNIAIRPPDDPSRYNPAHSKSKAHVIEDIRMRGEDNWCICTCGTRFQYGTSGKLAAMYAKHIQAMKGAQS